MKSSSGQSFICHGFNNHFESPKFIGEHRVVFRTAVVIKKRDFYDEWDVYDNLFWRMVVAVATEIADAYCIKVTDQTAPTFDSVSELRAWQTHQEEVDFEFVLDPPGEIDLFSESVPICHMELEDWSDIVKYEPYACSYTFSFYSYNGDVNAKIGNALHKFLSSDKEISAISVVNESPRPKWYWPFLDVLKSDTFFIYAGFCILVFFAIAVIVVSPSSTHGKVNSFSAKLGSDNLGITWRRDVAPIQKRIAVLASCTNMLWHGEIITKSSFLNPPLPNTYRICCFIPNASQLIHDLPVIESSHEFVVDGIDFLPAEKVMLKSEYKIDSDVDKGVINEQLTHKLLQSPYRGQSIYFKTSDVLCIVLFGE